MTPQTSLLKWLATFELNGQPAIDINDDAYYNLADGFVCARVLNKISSDYFPDTWLDGIRPVPPNGSWRLRVSNLKRILQKIHDFSSDLQDPHFTPISISPDVAVIAQNFDPEQIGKLLQLILFCAIHSEKKHEYVEIIRDLPTKVKQDIKESIEELIVKNPTSQDVNTTVGSSQNLCDPIGQSSPIKSSVSSHVENDREIDRISTRMEQSTISKSNDDDNEASLLFQQNRKLISENHTLREELINVEAEKEDFRLKSDLLKDDLDRLSRKLEEVRGKAEQSRRLQDELDEVKHLSEKTASYEIMIENLERKNNEFKKELKAQEDKNVLNSNRIIALQEENTQLANNASRVEIYKKKLREVQARLSQETHRADKAEAEVLILNDKYSVIKKENEKLYETTNQLMVLNPSSDSTGNPYNKIRELQRMLLQKEQELAESEARYQKSLKKAKEVMKNISQTNHSTASLHPSCISSVSSYNSNSLEEIHLLKQQLLDRDERLAERDIEFNNFKQLKEFHERLMISAFYGLVSYSVYHRSLSSIHH